ncbi:hypothetical protein MMC15_007460, partial [Xylographa vitiligo]|nr:hypothetical protein [Xylographa vitiligo]
PDLARTKPDLARTKPDLARIKPDLARIKPDPARTKQDLAKIKKWSSAAAYSKAAKTKLINPKTKPKTARIVEIEDQSPEFEPDPNRNLIDPLTEAAYISSLTESKIRNGAKKQVFIECERWLDSKLWKECLYGRALARQECKQGKQPCQGRCAGAQHLSTELVTNGPKQATFNPTLNARLYCRFRPSVWPIRTTIASAKFLSGSESSELA